MSVTYKAVRVPDDLWPKIVMGMRARQDRDPEHKEVSFAMYALDALMAQVERDTEETDEEETR